MAEGSVSLAELRQKSDKKNRFVVWLRKVWPALFDWKSLFWFFWFIFVLGIFWMFYSFFFNSGTQMYWWGDYVNQYCNLAYGFWDVWNKFFKTGVFELYSTSTFFGTDNIGSNAYYGLFDPFIFVCVLLPRSLIPQNMALATCLKGCVGALACRAYLGYLGISERGSRIGGVAFAFNGYLNFMVGFPSVVSVAAVAPLVLLGIEKVIKEKKPTILVFSLALMGLISFFFLVVFCIFGVIYALWRYFWTLKKRSLKENLWVIGLGIGSFAVGILLCSWVLIPSIRESSLSPRISSIGGAYLATLIESFKGKDFATAFSMIFEIVGENPGRELQGLVSFVYPTAGFTSLPLYGAGYDSWTASLFVYTPLAIFFFGALISSIRNKRWDHIIAFILCLTMVFTIFPYYFFYAFSGDGYGRWYIVLVPIIIYYACSEFDRLKEEPRWQLPVASVIELMVTILAWVLVVTIIQDHTFSSPNNLTYYIGSYNVPNNNNGMDFQFIVYYQLALVCLESVLMVYFRDKDYFWKVVIAFVSIETIVCGNLSFATNGIYVYDSSFNGGTKLFSQQIEAVNELKEFDDGDYRLYNDVGGSWKANSANAVGFNGSETFHSLYNYGLSDFLRQSHIVRDESYGTTYGGKSFVRSTWSGQYSQKRLNFDTVAGFKYYMIQNEGYSNWDDDSVLYNVPLGAECVVKTNRFRIYQNPYCPDLGFGVDTVYALGNEEYLSEANPNQTFYHTPGGGWDEVRGNEATYLDAAIVDDGVVDQLPDSIIVSPSARSSSAFTRAYLSDPQLYVTVNGYGYNAEDPGSFLTDPSTLISGPNTITGKTYPADNGKVVYSPASGTYFNTDKNGSYFEMRFPKGNSAVSNSTRIYFIGDTFDSNGFLVDTNVALNYEYHSIDNTQGGELGGSSFDDFYGFYAPGRVKYVVLCAKGTGDVSMPVSKPVMYYLDKGVIDAKYATLTDKEHAVTDVTHTTDRFTCRTDFSTSKFVTTHIGYDAGWKVTATKEDGTVETLTTYRLDGGLVGFIAPSGATSYVLLYETPSLKTGFALSTIGMVAYLAYEIAILAYGVRQQQKELNVDYWLRPRPGTKKKGTDPTDVPPSSSPV